MGSLVLVEEREDGGRNPLSVFSIQSSERKIGISFDLSLQGKKTVVFYYII